MHDLRPGSLEGTIAHRVSHPWEPHTVFGKTYSGVWVSFCCHSRRTHLIIMSCLWMVHVLCTNYFTEKVTLVVETLIFGRNNEGRGGCTLSELLTLSHGARCQEKEQAIIWFRVLLTWQEGRNRQAGLTKRHLKVLQQSRVRIRPLPRSWQIWSNPREVCHPEWHIPKAGLRGAVEVQKYIKSWKYERNKNNICKRSLR